MADINKLIATLEYCLEHGSMGGHECFRRYYINGNITETNARANCPNKDCQTGCVVTLVREVIALLKAQEPREPHYTKLEYIVNGMPVKERRMKHD